jgi:hypothetical protein
VGRLPAGIDPSFCVWRRPRAAAFGSDKSCFVVIGVLSSDCSGASPIVPIEACRTPRLDGSRAPASSERTSPPSARARSLVVDSGRLKAGPLSHVWPSRLARATRERDPSCAISIACAWRSWCGEAAMSRRELRRRAGWRATDCGGGCIASPVREPRKLLNPPGPASRPRQA